MLTRPRSSRIAAAALLLGPAVYLTAEAVSAAAWTGPTYSYLHNWISDLGSSTTGTFQGREIDSPLYQVMNAGFLIQGLLFGVGVLAIASRLPGRLRRTVTALTVATSTGYVLLAAFHGSPQAAEDGTLALHHLGATLAIVGANALATVLGAHWWKDPMNRSLGHASVPLGVLGLVAVTALFSTMGSGLPAGLIERVSVCTAVAWQVRVALQLLLAGRRTPGPDADATPGVLAAAH